MKKKRDTFQDSLADLADLLKRLRKLRSELDDKEYSKQVEKTLDRFTVKVIQLSRDVILLDRELTRAKNDIKVGPVKYFARHFREVERLRRKGYKAEAALEEVADKYGFPFHGFKQQYYDRNPQKKSKAKLTNK